MDISKGLAALALLSWIMITAYIVWRTHKVVIDPAVKQAKKLYEKLYKNVDSFQVAWDEHDRLELNDVSYTYGEIDFYSFASLLDIAKPQQGDNFYDLGTGAGRPCFVAGLLYPFAKVRGVEKLPALYKLCLHIKNKFAQDHATDVDFIQDDIADVNCQDADIVFINATCFFGEFWDNLVDKLKQLKSGSRIILSSKSLPLDEFELIESGYFKMSWSHCFVSVYKRK